MNMKFVFWRRGEGEISPKTLLRTLLFLRKSMTMKFGKYANFFVRDVVTILQAPYHDKLGFKVKKHSEHFEQ